jgi:hypothetical protein
MKLVTFGGEIAITLVGLPIMRSVYILLENSQLKELLVLPIVLGRVGSIVIKAFSVLSSTYI